MHNILLIMPFVMAASNANPRIRTQTVDYLQGGAALEGYLAYDEQVTGPRPGVLVVHEWWGINEYIRKRTERLASLGYFAFAADIYGKGNRAATREEAMALAGKFRSGTDRSLMRARVNAGLDELKNNPLVDRTRVAAIGYCFGGTVVLELARSGADLTGVVCFHGGLATPNPDDAKNIMAKVLVLNGADDPSVKPEQVAAFEEEMRRAGVDWQLVSYGHAVHGFTNPDNGTDNTQGAAYNEKADSRSWAAMKNFFEEIFR